MSHDPKCEELAQYFLRDEPLLRDPEHVRLLAELIQSSVENWIGLERDEAETDKRFSEEWRDT